MKKWTSVLFLATFICGALSAEDFLKVVRFGTLTKIKSLVDGGTPALQKDKDKVTSLMCAAENPDPEVTAYFLKAGGSVSEKDREGLTALMHGAQYAKNPKVMDLLLAAGSKIQEKPKSEMSLLSLGARNNPNPEIIRWIIAHGFDVNEKNPDGRTPLMLAAGTMVSSVEVLETLVKAGADLNMVNISGKTALMFAAGNRDPKFTQYLIKAGADGKIKSKEGKTALDYAAGNSILKASPVYKDLEKACR